MPSRSSRSPWRMRSTKRPMGWSGLPMATSLVALRLSMASQTSGCTPLASSTMTSSWPAWWPLARSMLSVAKPSAIQPSAELDEVRAEADALADLGASGRQGVP